MHLAHLDRAPPTSTACTSSVFLPSFQSSKHVCTRVPCKICRLPRIVARYFVPSNAHNCNVGDTWTHHVLHRSVALWTSQGSVLQQCATVSKGVNIYLVDIQTSWLANIRAYTMALMCLLSTSEKEARQGWFAHTPPCRVLPGAMVPSRVECLHTSGARQLDTCGTVGK